MAESSRCPHAEPFAVRGERFFAAEILDLLAPHLTEKRAQRIRDIVAQRTYSVVPVLEGLYDLGNVNAVLRSAEALGCQVAHVIELTAKYKKANRVSKGADKWLDIQRWDATEPCVAHLRGQGYRIVATHAQRGRPIADAAFDRPIALFFGNEHAGVSETLLDTADDRVRLPMLGFTGSYNISAAAAIALYHVFRDRERRLGRHSDLSAAEMVRLTAVYYRRSIERADDILWLSRQPT